MLGQKFNLRFILYPMCKNCVSGRNGATLKERTVEHKCDIKFQKDKPIMRHFRNLEQKDLSVAIRMRTTGENKIYTFTIEEKWLKN